ncbi:hypothetical protein G5I_13016 [Acromyrmex echinatior]|uniref:Uncharacterized protein n=1 Tax=Acromyrmex echinatior TaxID=103372 RepID=F4X3V3_ACREC|nr:hypothetical protein G5I_13016 [Acromyrmex echinatior]
MREDWYKLRVQGHKCEGYRTSLPPSRANLSDTVRRHSLFHAREKEEEEEEQRERGVADGASGFHGNAASTAPTLRTGVVPTRVESVAARDGGGSDGGAAGTKGDGNRPSGTVTVGASPFDAACWCVLFYGVIEKNLEKPGYTGVIANSLKKRIVKQTPNEGSSRHLPPPPSRLINVILLDGQASTTIDTWRGGGDGSGGGGGGGGGIVTFASRGTRNEERDETDGAERKGHRPAPQTDWPHSLRYPKRALTVKREINPEILQQHSDLRIYAPPGEVSGMRHASCNRQLVAMNYRRTTRRIADHTVVSPRTRDNERNWRLWSQEELGISSRRAAEYNTRAYNDVGLTIAYSRAGTNGTDRVNTPVYHREDNKQEYANITDDLCLRPPSQDATTFWKLRGILFQGRRPSVPHGKRDYNRNYTTQWAGGRDGMGERKAPTVSLFPGTREFFNDQKRRAESNITTTRALNYDTRNEFLPPSEWLTALSPGRAQQGAPAPDPKDVTRNEHTLRIFSGRLIDKCGKVLLVVEYRRSYRLYFWNWPCKMKGRLELVASSQVRLSAYGRLEPARRAPRRKTADLYFFVEGAAGWPVHELRAVCVPYTGCAFHQPITNREDELSLKESRDLDQKRHWLEYLGQVKLVMEKLRTMLLFFRKMAKLVLTLTKIALI